MGSMLRALSFGKWGVLWLVVGTATSGAAAALLGQDAVPPEFLAKDVDDPVARLIRRLESGKTQLAFEGEGGYLKSLLKELAIPLSTQLLVFSKTSLQSSFISHSNPRAVYFSQDAYVGFIPGAQGIELIGIDPKSGPMFYFVENKPSAKPELMRKTDDCFQCHFSSLTSRVPGMMARSVFAGEDGTPKLSGGSFKTTQASAISERWGGWFVTGTHGAMRHMGNEAARGEGANPTIDREKGANVLRLDRYMDVDLYPTPHSDIVALMICEQQMSIQNLVTKAGLLTRTALKDGAELLKLKFDPTYVAEQTKGRIHNACEPLVRAILGLDEPKLTDPIRGTSGFADEFAHSAPEDGKGRRLSQLDLSTKLLRYPCSPMVYSQSVASLPEAAKSALFRRIAEVLSSKEAIKGAGTFVASDGQAALEILVETLPEFARAIKGP